jgi:hypothetical protein
MEADEAQGGVETQCKECGAATLVPLDMACDDLPSSPDAKTITMEELEALRREVREQQQQS